MPLNNKGLYPSGVCISPIVNITGVNKGAVNKGAVNKGAGLHPGRLGQPARLFVTDYPLAP